VSPVLQLSGWTDCASVPGEVSPAGRSLSIRDPAPVVWSGNSHSLPLSLQLPHLGCTLSHLYFLLRHEAHTTFGREGRWGFEDFGM